MLGRDRGRHVAVAQHLTQIDLDGATHRRDRHIVRAPFERTLGALADLFGRGEDPAANALNGMESHTSGPPSFSNSCSMPRGTSATKMRTNRRFTVANCRGYGKFLMRSDPPCGDRSLASTRSRSIWRRLSMRLEIEPILEKVEQDGQKGTNPKFGVKLCANTIACPWYCWT